MTFDDQYWSHASAAAINETQKKLLSVCLKILKRRRKTTTQATAKLLALYANAKTFKLF